MDHPITRRRDRQLPGPIDRLHLEPGTTYRTDRVIDNPAVTHNSYLGPLAEIGIVGFGCCMSIFGLLDRLRRPRRPAVRPQPGPTDGERFPAVWSSR